MAPVRFLPLGQARAELNVTNRSQMQNLFPLLPHVYFVKRQTRFFPAIYIASLADFLAGRSATLSLVREFNKTPLAAELYRSAVADLEAAIGEREEHTPGQVAELFDVTRATVNGWTRSRDLPYTEKKLQGGQIVPKGPRQRRTGGRQFIAASTLRQHFKWVSPF